MKTAAVSTADRIDVQDHTGLERWARKFDATPDQLREAVGAVGDLASDVEEHLKGSRATTNRDRVAQAPPG